jgi:hypothetical protein
MVESLSNIPNLESLQKSRL